MTTRRLHLDPRSFGRRQHLLVDGAAAPAPTISEDLKLFATTYAAGFLFVSLFLV